MDMDVPKDIKKFLTNDEIVEQQFELNNGKVYASTKRLFIKTHDFIRDISYTHISSIEYRSKRQWLLILVGILALVVWYFLQRDTTLGYSLLFAGFVLNVVGFLWKKQRVELGVTGLSNPVILLGQKDTLSSLFKLIRERRV